ncbi:hypothetical protein ACVNIS_00740 [Sphaerotilaceae bacterium SBD11-9]
MSRSLRAAALALLAAPLIAWAQEAIDPAAAGAQNPAPLNGFEFEGGKLFNYRDSARNDSYYRVSYKGALVNEKGTPFKLASGLDLAAPAEAASAVGAGDRHKWSLRYEHGTSTVGGGLFEAAGVQPFALRGLEKLDLRGTAAVASDEEGDNVQFALGLETPPMRLPGLRGTEVSNWIVFGVDAQRQKSASTQSVDNHAMLTYRAFVGKAFGWRKSADVGSTAQKLERAILAQAPTLAAAQGLKDKLSKIPAAQRSSLQQLLLDAVVDTESEDDWVAEVRGIARGQADAITDQPTWAVYAEATGWYTASGPLDEGPRFRNLLTISLDYWFLPGRDDVFVRLRYENGYEWALPRERKNQLLASVGLRF